MLGVTERRRKIPHRFRFEECWLGNGECEKTVAEAWIGNEGNLHRRLAECGNKLDAWGAKTFGDVPKRIRNLQNKLQHLNSIRQQEGIILQIKE
ncbi:hypothetical protein PIB30_115578, partial [Stylosanthes scabra]|nr:hypothetical protein [Stylosanthes scabra]